MVLTAYGNFEEHLYQLNPTTVTGLTQGEQQVLNQLVEVWQAKHARNQLRTQYYNGKERVQNLRIAVPDRIANRLNTVVGWPAKAVKSLADLSVYRGLNTPIGLDEASQLAAQAKLDIAIPEAIVSAYKHSCSFLCIYSSGMGRVAITPRSALMSSALWDYDTQQISACLTITGLTREKTGDKVTKLVLWLPGKVCEINLTGKGWVATSLKQTYPGVSVVPIVYDPQLDRPFGRSRITRPLIAYTDMAIRTLIRQEATAEFYSAPHLWMLGASKDILNQDTWSSLVNAINGVSKDEDGDHPVIQQIAQASMQPHSDMLRTIAMLVSSETNIPVSDLGVTTENPASAESMAEAERKLTREAERQNLLFSTAIREAIKIAYCWANNATQAPAEYEQISPVWAETREISLGARADAYQKISASLQGFAQTNEGLRLLGFDENQISSILAQFKQTQSRSVIQALITGGTSNGTATQSSPTSTEGKQESSPTSLHQPVQPAQPENQ